MGCKYCHVTVGLGWNFLHDEPPNPRNFQGFERAVSLHFRGVMTTFRMFLRQIRDPRWIPHISSYCDSRCHQCAFRERCWTYAFRDDPDALPHDLDLDPEEGKPSERHIAIDLDDIELDSNDVKEYEEQQRRIDNDPLVKCARELCHDMYELLKPFPTPDESDASQSLPAPVLEAIDDLRGLSLTINAKTCRALGSYEFNKKEQCDNDPIQNDANGSVKVSLLAIEQSLVAWHIIDQAAIVDAGLVRYVVENLTRLKAGLLERFPLAMAFVRPGFDEEIPGIVRPWSVNPDQDDEEDGAPLL